MPSDLPSLRREYIDAGLSEADLAPTLARAVPALVRRRQAPARAERDGPEHGGRRGRRQLAHGPAQGRSTSAASCSSPTTPAARAGRWPSTPGASLLFPWIDLERQVVVTGSVQPVAQDETDAYFRSRPRGAQIAAWASRQSTVIASREVLEQRVAALDAALRRQRRAGAAVLGRPAPGAGQRGVLAGPAVPAARPAAVPPRRPGVGRGAARPVTREPASHDGAAGR